MQLKNITASTIDIERGKIARDDKGSFSSLTLTLYAGNPIGCFMEAAQNYFNDILEVGIFGDNSNVPLSRRMQGLEVGIHELIKCGVTAFQDAIIRPGLLEAYLKYYEEVLFPFDRFFEVPKSIQMFPRLLYLFGGNLQLIFKPILNGLRKFVEISKI